LITTVLDKLTSPIDILWRAEIRGLFIDISHYLDDNTSTVAKLLAEKLNLLVSTSEKLTNKRASATI